MPVSSAQIKSAILLAGVAGEVEVALREPHGRSRDHTERLLRAFGYGVSESDGWIRFSPSGRIEHRSRSRCRGSLIGGISGGRRGAGRGRRAPDCRGGRQPNPHRLPDVLARMGAPVRVENEPPALESR